MWWPVISFNLLLRNKNCSSTMSVQAMMIMYFKVKPQELFSRFSSIIALSKFQLNAGLIKSVAKSAASVDLLLSTYRVQ